ncbi:3-hydroxy-3-methylglutaryl-CoA lyase [Streptomyces sp. SID14515]|uniref:3-hydroxy-3-methylglutaryl-CoA lyase n=1 Tax=Streptomyces sp. SID14515 TaxID=2706074 RepID=UPI0013CAACF7|nr:3-hydroxy-3-methylglutaryl-CoA lyase [Streptomyces sp. SID14515]NEB36887.1 3-hydroxy-3-methylglutaryl-CoA lyase [Streptomyces sp. SID14515]
MSIVNIDVTLRDGGYRNGFNFPLDYALTHARLSVESGFDWVEIAYRKGSLLPVPNLGLTGRGEDEFIAAVAREVGPDKVAMILHPKNITEHDLPAMYAAGARLVRIILPSRGYERGLEYIRQARDIGFRVGVNFARISQWEGRDIVEVATAATDAGAEFVYLADSNGSLSPVDTTDLTTLTKSVTGSPVGLHAHNNLGLALSNAICAVTAGATWMDSSIQGMGKGPGNLIAEQWLAHLDRTDAEAASRLRLGPALELADLLLATVPEGHPSLPLPDLVLGRYDLPVEHRKDLLGGNHREGVATARTLAAVR